MMSGKKGFTIVELLIVIVVIGILATVVTSTFSGAQQQARNSQTISAALAWYKAFKLYEADHGEMPHAGFDSCLGEDYPWDFEGNTSGTNQCRHTTFSYYVSKVGIYDALRPYLGSTTPTPSMQAIGNASNWSRGLTYVAPVVGGNLALLVTLEGESTCPDLAGQPPLSSNASYGNGITCNYKLGTRLR